MPANKSARAAARSAPPASDRAGGGRRHRRSLRRRPRTPASQARAPTSRTRPRASRARRSRSPRRARKPRERLPVDRSKYQTIRSLDAAQGLDRARARCRPFRDRRRGDLDRSDAGRDLRHRAGARRRTTPAMCRSPTSSPATAPGLFDAGLAPDQIKAARRAGGAEAAAGIRRHPQDRLQHQVQRRDAGAARHHAAQPSTTRS